MAIDAVKARAIISFEGDASKLKQTIREVDGAQKKNHDDELARQQRLNQKYESQIATIAKWTVGIAAVAAAAKVAFDGMAAGAERARLVTAAGSANVEALRKASAGLVKETDLLKFAAQGRAGALKLDNEMTEASLRAMRALTQQGFEYGKVSDAITEAVVKGEVEGFKNLGITLRKTTTDAERHQAIKEKILELAGRAKNAHQSEGESMQASAVKYSDAMEKVKESFGRLAIALQPLVDLAARLANIVASMSGGDGRSSAEKAQDQIRVDRGEMTREQFDAKWNPTGLAPSFTIASPVAGFRSTYSTPDNSLQEALERQRKQEEEERRKFGAALETARKWAESPEGRRAMATAIIRGAITGDEGSGMVARARAVGADPLGTRAGAQGRFGLAGRDRYGLLGNEEEAFGRIIDNAESERLTEQWNAQMDRMRGIDKGAGAGIRGAQQSQFEKVFGKVSEIDAYKTAFDGLTGALNAGFMAWIDGSKSAGDAVKSFTKELLKTLASQALVNAAIEIAAAFGALARFSPGEAAGHFLAAGKYGAAAALAGVVASQIGGGGGGGGVSGSAPTGSVGASGGGIGAGGFATVATNYDVERGGSHQVIVVGDQFAEDSPRRRAANIKRQIERVGGANGVEAR